MSPEDKVSLLERAEEDLRAAEILRREDDELTIAVCFLQRKTKE